MGLLHKKCLIISKDELKSVYPLWYNYNYDIIYYKPGKLELILDHILELQPDIMMLDVDVINFEQLISQCHQYLQQIPIWIGLSKSKDQAYNCIKSEASDYLLQPLKEAELRKSILKINKKFEKSVSSPICLKSYSDYYFLNPEDIIYLKADNNNTDIYLNSGKKVAAFKPLKSFEIELPENFLRIHNSFIINADKLMRINFGKSQVYLKYDATVSSLPFSRSYRDKLNYLKELLTSQHIKISEN